MNARSLLLILLLGASITASLAGPVQGPVKGKVVTADDAAVDDVVVLLRCRGHGLHGTHGTDDESRVVAAGERFLFAWAYRGVSPAGCSVTAYHPQYVQAFRSLEKQGFSQDVGVLNLTSWNDFLAAGPTDPPMHISYPWPVLEFRQHLNHLLYHYVPAFPARKRRELWPYLADLHTQWQQVVATGAFGDWPMEGRQTPLDSLHRLEAALAYPGTQADLFSAVEQNDPSLVAGVAGQRKKINAWWYDGGAAVYLAANQGKTAAVIALADAGADLEQSPRRGHGSPLAAALAEGHRDTAATLLRLGAKRELKPHYEQRLAGAVGASSYRGEVGVLKMFLAAGIDADIRATNKRTPLMAAAQGGQVEAARILLAAGADVNARDDRDKTPLRFARSKRNAEMIALLESAGGQE